MRVVLLSLMAIGAGCAPATAPDASIDFAEVVNLDQSFTLHIGERALINDVGLSIEFVEVPADSRCPSNALILCVWEGDGAVLIEATASSGGSLVDTLHTNLEPRTLDVASITLELVSLDPHPETTTPIPPEEYVATFVARGGG